MLHGSRATVGRAARPADADILLAVLLAVAAGVHGTLFPEHTRESVPLGIGFAVVAALQLAAAIAVLSRPSRRLFAAVAGGCAVAIAGWALARTTGLPYGAEPWTPEPIGMVDALTAAFEVTAAAVALVLAGGTTGVDRIGRAAAAAAWTAGAVGVFTLALAAEHDAHGDAAGGHLAGHALHAALVVAVVASLPLLARSSRRRPRGTADPAPAADDTSPASDERSGSQGSHPSDRSSVSGRPAQNGGGSLAGKDSSDARSMSSSSVGRGAVSSSERR